MCSANDTFEFNFNIERYGLLFKKSEQTGKWQNKFCILKDNFLIWYKEDDATKMKKTKFFNTKPQGMLFLNDCIIREFNDSNQNNCFLVEHAAFQKPQQFSAETQTIRDCWIQQMIFNSNINFINMLDTQRYIKELMDTTSTLKYATVKQKYDNAKDQNECLLKLKEDLEKENQEKETCISDLQLEFGKMKEELDEAYSVRNNLEKSKSSLEDRNLELENDLKMLETERCKTSQLLSDKNNKESEIQELQNRLVEISRLKEKVDQDRLDVQKKLTDKDNLTSTLSAENQRILNQAQELNNCIKKLQNYNLEVEKKLELETAARQEAERRLQEAEMSLGRLHTNIVDGGTKYTSEVKNEMTSDVNKLKDYFENLIRSNNDNNSVEPASPVPAVHTGGYKGGTVLMRSRSAGGEWASHPTLLLSSLPRVAEKIGDGDTAIELSRPLYNHRDSIRVRDESQKVREEHHKRISQIQWDL